MHRCATCGRPNDPRSIRCRACNGALARLRAAEGSAEFDRAILRMVAEEGLTSVRLARRLGVTRMQAHRVVKAARRRSAILEAATRNNAIATEPQPTYDEGVGAARV